MNKCSWIIQRAECLKVSGMRLSAVNVLLFSGWCALGKNDVCLPIRLNDIAGRARNRADIELVGRQI